MHVIVAVISIVLLTACSTYQRIDIPKPHSSVVSKATGASAGAASVDITPPPGFAKGGYSILGNNGIGFRTRLKSRIFYLNDGKGQSVALIQGDLGGSSLLLQHRIASLVGEKTGLKVGDIFVTGTHSHSSVGNHFHDDFYNKHFSNEVGLEPEHLELLSQRMAEGVIKAYESRRPAKVATGRRDIYGYNRNRMLDAYRLNPGKENIDLDDPETKFREVNPAMHMVRIDVLDDDGQYKPLGAFSSFSVHGTTITAPVEVYNGDLFAYAQRELEWNIQEKYHTSWPVLHGLTTSTQGDMAPAVKEEDNYITHGDVDFVASRKLGMSIGKEAIQLFNDLDGSLSSELTLGSAAREVNIRENNKAEDVEICDTAYVGTAVVGGAYERRTPWISIVPTFRGGWGSARWFFTDGCQAEKRIIGSTWFQPLFEPSDSFPDTVLFQIVRINDTLIMPLPFEMTSQAGGRAAKRVQDEFNAAGDNIKYSWVVSVANGYFGYSVTPEEYAYQSYEGAQTLYGRYNTPYVVAQLGALAKDFKAAGEVEELLPSWSYHLKTTSLLPKAEEATGERVELEKPAFVDTDASNEEDYIYFRWLDVNISKIDFHRDLVGIEVKDGEQWKALKIGIQPINDQGYDLEVRYLDDEDKGMAEYEARWYNPLAGGTYRFVIQPRLGYSTIYSSDFSTHKLVAH